MKKQIFKRKRIIIAITIFCILTACIVVINSLVTEQVRQRENVRFLLDSEADKLQYAIDSRLLNLTTLEMLIVENKGEMIDFDFVAPQIYREDPCIRCIQLAPNGVITKIYPLEGNESAFGNLFENAKRKDEAIYARDTGQMMLGGPYNLHQGGFGVVARRPIYITNDEGERTFWGFSIQVMDFDKLLEDASISALEKGGYRFQIWRYAKNGEREFLAGSENISADAAVKSISVPGATWYISLIPPKGWISVERVIISIVLLMVICVLFSLLSYYLIKTEKIKGELVTLANNDQLTGLYNRRYYYKKLDRIVADMKRFTLHYIDLDYFKPINDRYGHYIGDLVLKECAYRISNSVVADCDIFRLGGDEFAIISSNGDAEVQKSIKKRVYTALSAPFEVEGISVELAASCGYAIYPTDATDISEITKIADNRMYEEKSRRQQHLNSPKQKQFFTRAIEAISEHSKSFPESKYFFFHIDYVGFRHINRYYGYHEADGLLDRSVEYIKSINECLICERGGADSIFFITASPEERTRAEQGRRFEDYAETFLNEEQKRYLLCRPAVWCGISRIVGGDIEGAADGARIAKRMAKLSSIKKTVLMDDHNVEEIREHEALEQRVHEAIINGGVFYVLQPQIDIETGRMISSEALGRIRDSEGEIISPAQFIPILEESTEMCDFDLKILDMVCKDIRERLDMGLEVLPVSVNLSKLHLKVANTARHVHNIIDSYNVPPELICFEISENVDIEQMDALTDLLDSLHAIGVSVSLDDFGTGYSDIGIIKRVTVDELKIDRSLLPKDRGENDKNYGICSTIMTLVETLNMRVVFEGVETAEQRDIVGELGGRIVQGFFYSVPKDPKTIYSTFIDGRQDQ